MRVNKSLNCDYELKQRFTFSYALSVARESHLLLSGIVLEQMNKFCRSKLCKPDLKPHCNVRLT